MVVVVVVVVVVVMMVMVGLCRTYTTKSLRRSRVEVDS